MASDVEIKVKATGARGAADDIDRVNTSLRDTDDAGRTAAGGFSRVGEGADTADTRAMGFRDTITGFQDLNRGLTGDFDSLGDQLLTLGMGFGDLASGIANFGVQFAQQAATFIANTARMVASHVASVATVIAGWVAQGVAALVAGAQMALAWLIGLGPIALVILAIGAIIGILAALGVGFDDIKKLARTVWDFILGIIRGVKDWVAQNWPLLLAILTGPFGLAVLAISRNWQTIKDGATAVKDWVVDKLSDVADFITGLPGMIIGGIGDAVSAVGGFVSDIASAIKGAINSALHLPFTIHGPGPLPDFTIPAFHQGGIFRSGAGQNQGLALLKNREGVFTPDQMAAMGGPGVSVTIYVQGSVVTERELVGAITQGLREKGVI